MKSVLTILLFTCIISFQAKAQFGLDINYGLHDFKEWKDIDESKSLYGTGLTYGVDYWFKPIEQRMEMSVGLSYGQYENQITNTGTKYYSSLNELRLNIKNNFYMFSFNDCNTCPTFNKKGETFKRGLFLQSILGASMQFYDFDDFISDGDYSSTNTAFHIGAGAGFDIRVTKLINITPYFNYLYGFSNSYGVLKSIIPTVEENTNRSSIVFGIRIGYKRDKNNF